MRCKNNGCQYVYCVCLSVFLFFVSIIVLVCPFVSSYCSCLFLCVCYCYYLFLCVCYCSCLSLCVCYCSCLLTFVWSYFCYFFLFLDQCVESVARYIQQQNYHVFEPKGVILGDPMDRGLRCVSLKYDKYAHTLD